ncbi:MAG: hypothetical protein JXJ04_07690 [Spirochaetales bacterium]|nr:hypothetical protein [Spirochaetales bacterium]
MRNRELKTKTFCIAFIMLLFCIVQAYSVCGDVNTNGTIDIVDALLVSQYYVGLNPAGFDSSQADVNGDGALDIIDALLIAQYYVGLITSLPGCSSGTPAPTGGPGNTLDPNRTQAPYPSVDPSSCGGWVLLDNVCTARYCTDDLSSQDCGGCGGNTGALCHVVSSKAAVSGSWPVVTSVSNNEPWHYSRSTNFGITLAGACQFGIYNVCSSAIKQGDKYYQPECQVFCSTYPDLCAEPPGNTFRGNWAAPQGNYYTQFWPTLVGDWDNYLSCGECFEVARTKKDGTDYQAGESGYTPPITLVINDSCPCAPNAKWCCGAGRNHCYEVEDFTYGCPMPGGDLPPDRDPSPEESIHLDLGGIAMTRLQSGNADGNIVDGVVPIKYRRVPCPAVGNIHIQMFKGASEYWFGLSVVNVTGLGSVTIVEALDASGEWLALVRDQNYTSSRPQERSGTWVVPQGAGPFELPVSVRFTNAAGTTLVADDVITSWTPPSSSLVNMYFIDTGVQF